MQFDRRIGDVRVVNAGSVGMPFGEPGACWALLGPDGVELRRTAYDVDAAAERLRESGYPAELRVQRPPTEAEMLEVLEAAALR
jgi:diadenosine tetraphosphatase ApaH/serine/threonine PP2A family protein phosphatase